MLLDNDGCALVTIDDRANEVRICSRHQRRPATLAEKVHCEQCRRADRWISGLTRGVPLFWRTVPRPFFFS